MVIYGEEKNYSFPLYWMDDLVVINEFNSDYLAITKMEIIEILEDFFIMSSREMVEFNQCDDWERKLDEYLRKFVLCFRCL